MSISLYKEFTRRVQPPRALWVPFPFGRPLGAPNNRAIQRKVILAALDLLAHAKGPVLEDLVLSPDEEHLDARNQTVGSKCSVKGCNFEDAVSSPSADAEARQSIPPYDGDIDAVESELREHRRAYDTYVKASMGRSQVGHSGLNADTIFQAAQVLHGFVQGKLTQIPQRDALPKHDPLTLELFIRLNADDMKTYFMEARLGTPESSQTDTGDFNEWFWFNTRSAALIKSARDRILEFTDRQKDPYCVVARGMVPRGYGEEKRMNPVAEPAAVVVYHGDACSACHSEMEFLAANKIEYVPKNVTRDTKARQELLKLGSRTVPTTVVNGQVIVGFELERLKQLLRI